jgi:hypothetical protein
MTKWPHHSMVGFPLSWAVVNEQDAVGGLL